MNRQSVFFLQAMWDLGIERDRIIKLGRENFRYETERSMKGVLHPQTVWLSEESKKIKQRLLLIEKEVEKAEYPEQLSESMEEYKKVSEEIQKMQIQTIHTLNAASGPLVSDLHILVRQLFPLALKRIKEQVRYELYRLMVLSGQSEFHGIAPPEGDFLPDWAAYYKDTVHTLIHKFDISTLDGRWAYERTKIVIGGKIRFVQFVSAEPKEEEILIPPGKAGIRAGTEGRLRIYGRGHITNLIPDDMPEAAGRVSVRKLSGIKDYSKIQDENRTPEEILNGYFKDRKYLVSPEEYFRFINMFLIARDFYPRMQRGDCIYCGLPLYQGACPKCGSRT